MPDFQGTEPVWAGRVPQHLIERLYEKDAQGIIDEELINEVGYALLARVESILVVTHGLGDRPICPRCRNRMDREGDVIRCAPCNWSTSFTAFRKSHNKKRLVAGGMLPFFEAFLDDFTKARDPRMKMRFIDILIHRLHGEYEQAGRRSGAINVIGGKPQHVLELLDRLAGYRRPELASEKEHEAWVNKVRRERKGVLDR